MPLKLQLEIIFNKQENMIIKPRPLTVTLQRNEIYFHCLRAGRQPWSHEHTLRKSMGCHGCQVRRVWAHWAGSTHVPAFGGSAVEHSNDIHSVRDLIHWTHDGVLSQRLLLNTHCLSWVDIYFQLLLWRSSLLPLLQFDAREWPEATHVPKWEETLFWWWLGPNVEKSIKIM